MFTSLTLLNFKAFARQEFQFAPISVFIGPNGSGKSTVLQALAFLKQSLRQKNATYSGELVDLGDFGEVVHFGDKTSRVSMRVSSLTEALKSNWPRTPASALGRLPIKNEFEVFLRQSGVSASTLTVSGNGGRSFSFRKDPGEGQAEVFANQQYTIQRSSLMSGFEVRGYPTMGNFPEKERSQLEDFREDLGRLGSSLEAHFEDFYLVPAWRGLLGRIFQLSDSAHHDLIQAGGFKEFAGNAASALVMNRDLEDKVSDWLEAITGFRVQARVLTNRRVAVTMTRPRSKLHSRFTTHAHQEGFGTNQLATVLLQIALAGDYASVGLEEPELHLHPRSQSLLVDTLGQVSKQAHVQFFLTTHSERIVSRILLMIAKGELLPSQVALYAFQNEDGVSTAHRLEIDSTGRVVGGLPGFFEQDIEDMTQYLAALRKG